MSDVERPDINACIEHYGGNTKFKRSYATQCLFHDERHASMSVNTETNVYNCHACGAGGDSWTMIMTKEECDFRRAVEIAASIGFAVGVAGRGDSDLPVGYVSRRSRSTTAKGNRPRGGGWKPSWRSS